MDTKREEIGRYINEAYDVRHDTNSTGTVDAYVPLLNQVIGSEALPQTEVGDSMITVGLSRPLECAVAARPLLMTETLKGVTVESPDPSRVGECRRSSSTSNGEGMTEEERLKRRRQINRNSQRRIRERRAKELEELRSEFVRVRQENDRLHRQNECIAAEKAELLRQLQEITEKWQQTISENALLNREILQLKSKLEDKEAAEEVNEIAPPETTSTYDP